MSQLNGFSSPGKALLAGGYLVLDQKYKSYVVALSARMHSVIRKEKAQGTVTSIRVHSPQFVQGDWRYEYDHTNKSFKDVSQFKNPFLKTTLETILRYIEPESAYTVTVSIFSDASFHSTQDTQAKSSGSQEFLYHNKPINEVPKTGLGSSAGLVTVVTAALLSLYKPQLDLFSNVGLQTIHNLAQISHCLAQGKIGSGFDIAAAVYGSIVYRRFDPQIISQLVDDKDLEKLRCIVDTKWPGMIIEKCALPSKVKLLMGDVNSGSETPRLVSKVMAWKKAHPIEGEKLFENINSLNMKLVSEIDRLRNIEETDPKGYEELLTLLGTYSLIQLKHLMRASDPCLVEKLEPFLSVIESISTIRKHLQILTKLTGAEIEPVEQTVLLDNLFTLPGILGGVVPGAGGHDAICVLCVENSIDKILQLSKSDQLQSQYQTADGFKTVDLETIDRKLLDKVEWLDLHEQKEGLRLEPFANYQLLL